MLPPFLPIIYFTTLLIFLTLFFRIILFFLFYVKKDSLSYQFNFIYNTYLVMIKYKAVPSTRRPNIKKNIFIPL